MKLCWGQLEPGTLVISPSRLKEIGVYIELVIDGAVCIWAPGRGTITLDPRAHVVGVEDRQFIIWGPDGTTHESADSEWIPQLDFAGDS